MRLNEAFDKWNQGQGIFSYLIDMPWMSAVNPISLDFDYHGNFSGDKETSPLIDRLDQKPLSVNNIIYLAQIITLRYKTSWSKIWDSMMAEYDIMNPYTMIVNENNVFDNEENSDFNEKGVNNNRNSSTSKDASHTYGYNEGKSPTDEHTSTDSSNSSSNSDKSSKSVNTSKRKESKDIVRKGNYGFFTPNRLLTEEREYRMWIFFTECVYKNIDDVLTSNFYEV